MKNQHLQSRYSSAPATVTTLCLLAICASTLMAQSGRRAPKSVSIPAPTPESTPTPSPKNSTGKAPLPLIVGIDREGLFSNIPPYFYDSVLRSCADRLGDAPSVRVAVGARNVNRGEAVKQAKAEKEGYVILLQLRADNFGAATGNENLSQVYIEYFVFAPTTAKLAASGHTYQQGYRKGGVVVGPTTSGSGGYAEYRLKQAAREAAERILNALHISLAAQR